MKKFLIASVITASLALGLSAAAEAHSSFKLYFGLPHYSYNMGPDYAYRSGYGWYRPGYNRNRLSCGEARREVRNRGYREVRTVECNGATFTFRGWRNGRSHQLLVNSRTGAVWRG